MNIGKHTRLLFLVNVTWTKLIILFYQNIIFQKQILKFIGACSVLLMISKIQTYF